MQKQHDIQSKALFGANAVLHQLETRRVKMFGLAQPVVHLLVTKTATTGNQNMNHR
jgi:hypothetical protein